MKEKIAKLGFDKIKFCMSKGTVRNKRASHRLGEIIYKLYI